MKNKFRKLSLFLILAIVFCGIQPCYAAAAPKKYVKSISLSKKSLRIRVGQRKTLACHVKTKGKASKKIAVKASNKKIKVKGKKGKLVVIGKKAGASKITVTTKGKNKGGKKLKKVIRVRVLRVGQGDSPAATPEPERSTTPSPSPAAGAEVTKSEWIDVLMKTTGYHIQKELFTYGADGKVCYSFTDIAGIANADLIETAVRYGIIPDSGGAFSPDAAASREFLAVTSVRAIGFATEQVEVTYHDKTQLSYESEDAIAVQMGLLNLSENHFYPRRPISKTDKQNAVKILSDVIEAREVDRQHKDKIEYCGDVEDKKDVTEYSVSCQGETYTVNVPDGTSLDGTGRGDKVLLPATEDYPEGLALTITSNTLSADGTVRNITGTAPDDILDFVDTVDMEGTVRAEAENVSAVEGVATVEVTEGEKRETSTGKGMRASAGGGINLEDKTKLTFKVKEIETTFSFYLSELKYSVDFDRKGVHSIYIGLPSVLAIDTDNQLGKGKGFSKKIGDIQLDLAAGFSANLQLYLEASLDGRITMHFNLSNNIGMQYYNGQFYMEKSCEPKLDALIDVDADAGAKLQLGLYWMKGLQAIFGKEDPKPLYNVSTKWGLHGDASLHLRDDQYTSYEPLACVDLGLHLYSNVKVGEESVLGDKFNLKKEWVIFDEKNTPLKLSMHLENGKKVNTCTYKNAGVLLKEFAARYEYLCDASAGYDVYARYDEEAYHYLMQTDIKIKHYSYQIADYDSDGQDELLIASVAHYFNDYNDNSVEDEDEGFDSMKLQMYEEVNGSVQLAAEKDCLMENEWITSFYVYEGFPPYDMGVRGEMYLYKFQKDQHQIIAIESEGVSSWGDGFNFAFMAVEYSGNSFKDVVATYYSGSGYTMDTISEIQSIFSSAGLGEVNVNSIFYQKERALDFVKNPVMIGKTENRITTGYNFWGKVSANPGQQYRAGEFVFSRS